MTVDAGEPVRDGGEELRLVAAKRRRELGATAAAAMRQLDGLQAALKGLPALIRLKEAENTDVHNKLNEADIELLELVNGALLSGAINPDEALQYFDVPDTERASQQVVYEAIVDMLRKTQEAADDNARAKLAVADDERGIIWGELLDDVAPYLLHRGGTVVLGASIELERDGGERSPAIIPPNPAVSEGVLSNREILASALNRKPFSGGGLDVKFNPHELVIVGNSLDALEFMEGAPNRDDARYKEIEHGIEGLIKLREKEDGSLALSRFVVPAVNGNATETSAAIKVMQQHFPVSYKVLYENLAICMAHEPDHAVKRHAQYNPPLALDLAAVINFGPTFTQEQRMEAGMIMVRLGTELLAKRSAERAGQ